LKFDNRKKKILILFSRIATVCLHLIIQLFAATSLTKSDFGQFALGKSIYQVYDHSHLGTRFSMDRLLPNSMRKEGLKYLFVCQLIIYLVSFIFSILWLILGYRDLIMILFIVAGFGYASINTFKVYVRGKGHYDSYLKLTLIIDVLITLISLIALVFGGLTGFAIAFAFSNIICFIFLNSNFLLPFLKLNLFSNIQEIQGFTTKIFQKGGVLFFNVVILYFVGSADRLVIAHFYDFETLGNYSFITLFFSLLVIIPSTFIEIQVKSLMKNSNSKYFTKFGLITLFVTIGCTVIALIILPFILTYLPDYEATYPDIKIISIGIAGFTISQIISFYYHSIDHRKWIITANAFSGLIYLTILIFLSNNQHSMTVLVFNKVSYYYILLASLVLIPYFKIAKIDK
jgi:O-antigen/teichoic acid export membrane protein